MSSVSLSHQNPQGVQSDEEKQILKLIAQGSVEDLQRFLQALPNIDLTQIWDQSGGFNILHLVAYKNLSIMAKIVCNYVLDYERQLIIDQRRLIQDQAFQGETGLILSPQQKLANWINTPAQGEEGFTALHFAAFNGNLEMLQYFVKMGADINFIHRQSRAQLSLFHVAAQGDSPSVLAYLKKLLVLDDPQIVNRRDARMSTPLHWACYSGAENAVQYLLAWGADPNASDSSGITPLHIAVKSAEELKSARTVRLLLMKGAERQVIDRYGRRPIDIAQECKIQNVKKELISFLEEPNLMQKCMIQTPLKKVQRSPVSVSIFIVLYSLSFLYLKYFVFPSKFYDLIISFSLDPKVELNFKIFLVSNFVFTTIFFLLSWFTDPGYLKPSANIDFLSIIQKFDPNQLCAECELIKTKRCRHCNVCNRCVERYDHHCPWINNCVGYRNHGYFYIYIISLQVYMLCVFYIITLELTTRTNQQINLSMLRDTDIFTAIYKSLKGDGEISLENDIFISSISSLILLLICVVFMIPLLILVCVQTKNMISNETTSERFSKRKEQQSSTSQGQTTIHDMFPEEEKAQQLQQQLINYEDIQQQEMYRQAMNQSAIGAKEQAVTGLIRNCLFMACAEGHFETQEQLLENKLKTNV